MTNDTRILQELRNITKELREANQLTKEQNKILRGQDKVAITKPVADPTPIPESARTVPASNFLELPRCLHCNERIDWIQPGDMNKKILVHVVNQNPYCDPTQYTSRIAQIKHD